MDDINRGEFLEFRGMVMEHNRNTSAQLAHIQSHLDRQEAGKEEAHKAIWEGVRKHEEKDQAEFDKINIALNDIKTMINAKLSYGKGFLAGLAFVSSLFGGGIAVIGSRLLEIFK